MTAEGIAKLITRLIKTYPNTYGSYGREDIQTLTGTWAMALEGYSDDDITAAFKSFLLTDTKGFPPTIGQLVDLIPRKGMASTILTTGEAWALVLDAMRNVTYNPTDSFERLPELIRQVIGSAAALQDLANTQGKSRDFERQRFMTEYKQAVNDARAEAKKTGGTMPSFQYRDEDPNIDKAPRPSEVRRELYPFPGAIEVANPRTGVIFYVEYEGYPYGEGTWAEHGGLNNEKWRAWKIKSGGLSSETLDEWRKRHGGSDRQRKVG